MRAFPLLAALLACASPLTDPPRLLADGRFLMGTVLEIQIPNPGPIDSLDPLFARVEHFEVLFTRFSPQSALSRLNDAAGHGPQPVAPELFELLALSARYNVETNRAFDVTVGPLVELWTRAGERGRRPSRVELQSACARVGSEKVRLDPEHRRVELSTPGMSLDLGGIAKGWALDTLAAELRDAGVENAFLSFGGSSIYALGAPSDGPGWRVLVRDASDGFAGVVTLRDQSLSVSATLGQSFEIEGRHYGHILDPRSGEPVTTQRLAAVVAASGAEAEALSKALLVLDPQEGLALLERTPEAEGLLLDVSGARWQSSGWRAEPYSSARGSTFRNRASSSRS